MKVATDDEPVRRVTQYCIRLKLKAMKAKINCCKLHKTLCLHFVCEREMQFAIRESTKCTKMYKKTGEWDDEGCGG